MSDQTLGKISGASHRRNQLRLEVKDVFSQKGRRLVLEHLNLPEETRQVVRQHLELLESTERQKRITEQRMQVIVQQRDDVDLLRTLPVWDGIDTCVREFVPQFSARSVRYAGEGTTIFHGFAAHHRLMR